MKEWYICFVKTVIELRVLFIYYLYYYLILLRQK